MNHRTGCGDCPDNQRAELDALWHYECECHERVGRVVDEEGRDVHGHRGLRAATLEVRGEHGRRFNSSIRHFRQ